MRSGVLNSLVLVVLCATLNIAQNTKDRNCPALHEDGVKYFDIRLSADLEVPQQQTFYVCQQYKVPQKLLDKEYHIVAFTPLIDNTEIMHHMILFGCSSETPPSQPHNCGQREKTCRSFLTVWSLGFDANICLYPKTSISVGKGGYETLSLQIHWNNHRKAANMADSSGIRIHYTEVPKRFELGNVQIGQNDIEIPPDSVRLEHSGSCGSYCTRKLFTQPFYITRTFIHMHSLGVTGRMDHYRNGSYLRNIAYDQTYSYKRPAVHDHPHAIKILPGDEVKVTCWFTTVGGDRERNRTIYWGEGIEGEMCYAFVSYFPKAQGFDQCVKYATYDQCDNYNKQTMVMGDCDFRQVMLDIGGDVGTVRRLCDEHTTPKCNSLCAKSIRSIYNHPCMQGRLAVFLEHRVATTVNWNKIKTLHARIAKCNHSQGM